MTNLAGITIGGRYPIIEPLGQGGMAVVFVLLPVHSFISTIGGICPVSPPERRIQPCINIRTWLPICQGSACNFQSGMAEYEGQDIRTALVPGVIDNPPIPDKINLN